MTVERISSYKHVNSLVGHSPQWACVSVHIVNTFLFSLGIKGDVCFEAFPTFWWGTFIMLKMKVVYLKFLLWDYLTKLCLYIPDWKCIEVKVSSLHCLRPQKELPPEHIQPHQCLQTKVSQLSQNLRWNEKNKKITSGCVVQWNISS